MKQITVSFDATPDGRDVNIAAALRVARDEVPPDSTLLPLEMPATLPGYRDAEARVLWQYALVEGEWRWLGRVDIRYELSRRAPDAPEQDTPPK